MRAAKFQRNSLIRSLLLCLRSVVVACVPRRREGPYDVDGPGARTPQRACCTRAHGRRDHALGLQGHLRAGVGAIPRQMGRVVACTCVGDSSASYLSLSLSTTARFSLTPVAPRVSPDGFVGGGARADSCIPPLSNRR
eukprot:scaffold104_cov375-Prasinococcus_capsulatus_cf.AAC.18